MGAASERGDPGTDTHTWVLQRVGSQLGLDHSSGAARAGAPSLVLSVVAERGGRQLGGVV